MKRRLPLNFELYGWSPLSDPSPPAATSDADAAAAWVVRLASGAAACGASGARAAGCGDGVRGAAAAGVACAATDGAAAAAGAAAASAAWAVRRPGRPDAAAWADPRTAPAGTRGGRFCNEMCLKKRPLLFAYSFLSLFLWVIKTLINTLKKLKKNKTNKLENKKRINRLPLKQLRIRCLSHEDGPGNGRNSGILSKFRG